MSELKPVIVQYAKDMKLPSEKDIFKGSVEFWYNGQIHVLE